MVTIDQIEKGIGQYLDLEIMPKLPQQGLERVALGVGVALVLRKQKSRIEELRNNTFIEMTGIFDEDGLVDIDTLRDTIIEYLPKEGLKIDVPRMGVMKFQEHDIKQLADYILQS